MHWWDKLGEPRYGSEMVIRSKSIEIFNPYFEEGLGTIQLAWLERLVFDVLVKGSMF